MKNLVQGIKNIFYFLPVIWKFRDFDYRYNLDLLRHSLIRTANYIETNKRFVGWEEVVKDIREFIELTNGKEFFEISEEYNQFLTNMKFYPMENEEGHYTLENKNFNPKRADTLTKRANKWEEARWQRAYNLLKKVRNWWD